MQKKTAKKTQMLQTVDLPKTISDHHNHRSNHLDSWSVSEKKSFLFRASGISQTSWLGCSKVLKSTIGCKERDVFWKETKTSDAQAFNVISVLTNVTKTKDK